MKVIAVGTLKGGTGKTTMTFNMLGALAERGKVLAIDMDPQCNLTNNIGFDISDDEVYSCLDIFEDKFVANKRLEPSELVMKSPNKHLPNLDIIVSSIRLVATESRIGSRAGRERILLNYIEDHQDFFEQYDYIVIDTNPSMNIVNQNAFLAADSIILVTDPDNNSRIGLKLFIDLWDVIRRDLRKEDNIRAIVLNRGAIRSVLTAGIYDYLENNARLSKLFVPRFVREKEVYPKAAMAKQPMNVYQNIGPYDQRKSAKEAAKEIDEVVEYLIDRGVF